MEPSQPSRPQFSREPSPDRPIAQPPRERAACESCHTSKVKCTGGKPCARCSASKTECVYKLVSRIGKPKGSRNKSTLRRLQLEREQAARQDAERNFTMNPQQRQGHHSPDSHDPHWEELLQPRTWSEDSQVLGSNNPWPYPPPITTAQGEPHSTMSHDPQIGNTVQYTRPEDMTFMPDPLQTPDHGSSYTSSPPWSISSPPEFFTISPTSSFPAHSSCHCAQNLISQLYSFHRPEALSSTTQSPECFLTNTDYLVYAINTFLDCPTCEKNSFGLSGMATIFATYGRLFTALAGTPQGQPSPSGSSPHMTSSLNISRPLSFSSYQSSSQSEGTIRTMLIRRTVPKWLDACIKATRLLEQMQAGANFNVEIATGGEGSPTWSLADIENFARIVSRVKGELAVFA